MLFHNLALVFVAIRQIVNAEDDPIRLTPRIRVGICEVTARLFPADSGRITSKSEVIH